MKIQNNSTVYIGIVTFNSLKDLPSCIASINKETYTNRKIIVFDNNSSDSVVSWLHKHSFDVTVIVNSDNIGFGCAHNRIIQSIHLKPNDFYMPLNPDVVLDPSYVSDLLRALQKNHAQWGQGKLYLDKNRLMVYSTGHALRHDGFAFNIGYGEADSGQYDTEREIFGASAAASMISSRMIRTVSDRFGLFDSTLFMYYEDVELDWRARRAGLRCWYAPQATAVHTGARLSHKLELHSILNRYLSVFKNAYFSDLILYNIPIMLTHCFVRILITPVDGLDLLYRLIRLSPCMFRKRIKPRVSKQNMHGWFAWALRQKSKQPTTYVSRLYSFIRKQ